MIFNGSGGLEAFREVPGGRGYILTKFGPKRTHLTWFMLDSMIFVHLSFVFVRYSFIHLCQRHTGCVGVVYMCVRHAEIVLQH